MHGVTIHLYGINIRYEYISPNILIKGARRALCNTFHPLYPELHRLVLKTTGLTDLVKKALEGNEKIRIAFIFGSIATGTEKAESDVDLMVIGDVGLRRFSALLSVVPDQIGREVNPHTLSSEEFKRKKAEDDHFLTTVLGEPKIFVIGSEDDLNRLA